MLESLSEKLSNAFKKFKNKGKLTEDDDPCSLGYLYEQWATVMKIIPEDML